MTIFPTRFPFKRQSKQTTIILYFFSSEKVEFRVELVEEQTTDHYKYGTAGNDNNDEDNIVYRALLLLPPAPPDDELDVLFLEDDEDDFFAILGCGGCHCRSRYSSRPLQPSPPRFPLGSDGIGN
jgi:hypothetical protein